MSASVRASTKPGLVSRFAHLVGGGVKPRADDTPATGDDIDDVEDQVEDVEDDVEDLEDRVDDLEDKVEDTPDDDDKPAEAKAHKRGVAAGIKAERARCAAIFSAPEAGQNPTLAASLAFETGLPVKQALALLRAGGVATGTAKGGLRDRMAGVKNIALGTDASKSGNSDDEAFNLVVNSYALVTGKKKEA